jgi:hypothetical protein
VTRSSDGSVIASAFGQAGDIPAAADYDGDGKADITVFRPSDGIWYRINSSNSTVSYIRFGAIGDIPVAGAFVQ